MYMQVHKEGKGKSNRWFAKKAIEIIPTFFFFLAQSFWDCEFNIMQLGKQLCPGLLLDTPPIPTPLPAVTGGKGGDVFTWRKRVIGETSINWDVIRAHGRVDELSAGSEPRVSLIDLLISATLRGRTWFDPLWIMCLWLYLLEGGGVLPVGFDFLPPQMSFATID